MPSEQLIVHSQPTHAVAVFDDEDRAHGWRHQRLPEYKAGRAPMPETLVAEMPALRAAFEQRGIRCWASPGSEADDLAATLAVRWPRRAIRPPSSPPTKATASCCRPPSASATTFRSAGWTPLHRQRVRRHPGAAGGLLGAGGDQQLEGAGRGGHWTQKRRPAAERVSGPRRGCTPVWPRSRRSGAKAGRASGDGLHLPGRWPACRPTSSWTAICSSCG